MKIGPANVPERWRFLFRPLGAAMRARLELTLGIVLTTAAVVALAAKVPPDPARLAARRAVPVVAPRERPTPPAVRPEIDARTWTGLANAAATGDLATMDRLYDPVVVSKGKGLLGVAAAAGQRGSVEWLLDHGADADEQTGETSSPILAAEGHPEIVRLLLERGAHEASLTDAVRVNAVHTVDRLLAAGTPVDGDPSDVVSPLAAVLGTARGTTASKLAIVEKLLAAGAKVEGRGGGDDPVASAVSGIAGPDDLALLALIVKRGGPVTGGALGAALVQPEPLPVLEVLLKGHLDPGATAIALSADTPTTTATRKALFAKGVDWSFGDGVDESTLPLPAAVRRNDEAAVREMIAAGAPVNARFKDSTCPLGLAIESGNAGMVELLVGHGAEVNRRLPDGRTPLFAAAEGGDLRVLEALLARGARANDVVLDETALDAAITHGQLAAARVLHARGAHRAAPSADARRGGE